jgi:hypothetical protein
MAATTGVGGISTREIVPHWLRRKSIQVPTFPFYVIYLVISIYAYYLLLCRSLNIAAWQALDHPRIGDVLPQSVDLICRAMPRRYLSLVYASYLRFTLPAVTPTAMILLVNALLARFVC